jgi:hypothetical protein
MITTCSKCCHLYEAGSEEQANEPNRLCPRCFRIKKSREIAPGISLDYEHNCSLVENPKTGLPFCACLTEQGEAEVIQMLGINVEDIGDERYAEWAYFWLDRPNPGFYTTMAQILLQ